MGKIDINYKWRFGDRLKKLRELRGLSQSELSKKLNITQSTISHFENGNRLPSYVNLFVICKRMDWSADYLLGFTELNGQSIEKESVQGKLNKIIDMLENPQWKIQKS